MSERSAARQPTPQFGPFAPPALPQLDEAITADFQLIHAVDRDGHTAVMAAAAMDQVASVRLLHERGANLNVQDYEGLAALHAAVESRSVGAGLELLALGADPSITTNARRTPLDLVAGMPPKQRASLRRLTFALIRSGGKGAAWAALVDDQGFAVAATGTALGAGAEGAALAEELGEPMAPATARGARRAPGRLAAPPASASGARSPRKNVAFTA